MSSSPHALVCMRCRNVLDARSGYCRGCGRTYLPNPGDPPGLHVEHGFLLDAAISLTDPEQPGMLDIPEDVLCTKAGIKPDLPLGPPPPDGFDTAGTADLFEAIESPHPRHRCMAALRLGMLRSPHISGKLLEHLPDRDADVRKCILWALGRSRNPSLSGPLLGFLHMERDPLLRVRIIATLYRLLAAPFGEVAPDLQAALDSAHSLVRAAPSPKTHFERGLLHLRAGTHIKAIGDLTRTGDGEQHPIAKALLYRSEAFLMLGKPLFSMDDLILYSAPEASNEEIPEFILHRAALVALGRQISDAAQAKGLTDYADLFIRRMKALKKR
ncbi:MAG: HEAT repeat domain-containing protein [Pseudomonadota bacterium]